jgi:hypothetical protein
MTRRPTNRIRQMIARERAAAWLAKQDIDRLPYPRIGVRPEKGTRKLVDEIIDLMKSFSFEDPACRGRLPPANFKLLNKHGIQGFLELMRSEAEDLGRSPAECETLAYTNATEPLNTVGQWFFDRISPSLRNGHVSDHFFYIALQDGVFEVRFDFLPEVVLKDGTAYAPPKIPLVAIGGKKRQLLLHYHAVDQMAKRLRTTSQPTYLDNVTLHAAITHNVWDYVPVNLSNGQKSLRIDMAVSKEPDRTLWHEVYVRNVLGVDNASNTNGRLMCVLGYLPLVDDEEHLRAKTFLFPGYRNTPEHALVDSLPRSSPLRQRLECIADGSNQYEVFFGNAAEVLKWYHDHGVTQVFHKPGS